MVDIDYYITLEVDKSSSNSDIKKAYRRLVLKWHPDKNPDNQDFATNKFKEISEAYEVLSDDEKRKIYDQFGKKGLQSMNGEEDISSQVFAPAGPFQFMFHPFQFTEPEDELTNVFRILDPFSNMFISPDPGSGCNQGSANNNNGYFPCRNRQPVSVSPSNIDAPNVFRQPDTSFIRAPNFIQSPFNNLQSFPFPTYSMSFIAPTVPSFNPILLNVGGGDIYYGAPPPQHPLPTAVPPQEDSTPYINPNGQWHMGV